MIFKGLGCLMGSALAFALVWAYKYHPEFVPATNDYTGRGPMPEWLAKIMAVVFALAGVGVLAAALLRASRVTMLLKNLAAVLVLGFWALLPFWLLWRGGDFNSIPFLPKTWIHPASQAIMGLLGLLMLGLTGLMIYTTIREWKDLSE